MCEPRLGTVTLTLTLTLNLALNLNLNLTLTGAMPLSEVDLSGDFDPEAFDKRMAEVYNEDYYAQAGLRPSPRCILL